MVFLLVSIGYFLFRARLTEKTPHIEQMNISSLPGDILVLILKKASCRTLTRKEVFKRNLVLLHVCREWRFICLPIVYSYLYIKFGKDIKNYDLDAVIRANGDLASMLVDTNITLIVEVGCISLARTVDICIHYMKDPFWELSKVVGILSSHSTVWSSISFLRFSMWSAQRQRVSNADVIAHALELAQTINSITTLLPNISKVDVFGYSPNLYANALYRQLVDSYSGNLRVLSSTFALNLQHKLQQIEHVQLPLDAEINYQTPQMSLNNVKRLVLPKVPFDFQLSDLDVECGSKAMVLDNLDNLEIVYSLGSSLKAKNGAEPCKIHLPNLRSLYITNYTRNTLLVNTVFPAHMNTVSIQGFAPDIASLQNIRLPKSKELIICVDSEDEDNNTLLGALQRIFKSSRHSTRNELMLSTGFSKIDPESISGLNISHLTFLAPAQFDTVIKVIKALPSLASINVSWLVMDAIQTDISIPKPGEEESSVQPFASNITELTLDYVPDTMSNCLISVVAKYFLLMLPKLGLLDARLLAEEPIVNFIQKYATTHPHLKNVQLRLSEY